MFNDKSILVTGGTGSFGKAFVREVLRKYPKVKRLIIFSRDELKQYEMAQDFSPANYKCLRYFLGDVRDFNRVKLALDGVDYVVHAAALKQVPAAEYNPFEFIKTNILGAENIVQACLGSSVKKVVALSTDKAAAPINLYGATKLCSDKLFTAANNVTGSRDLQFSIVRYGNVMGSRGSVIPFFLNAKDAGFLPITDPNMTRFNITLQEGVDMVLWAFENARGGETFVPKIPSYRILDVAEAVAPGCDKRVVGVRPGEKLHEEMITSSDSLNTVDLGNYYAILPAMGRSEILDYCAQKQAIPVDEGFSYNSGSNPHFLSVEELQKLIAEHVDVPASNFSSL